MKNGDKPPSIAIVSLGACALTEKASGFPVGGSEWQLFLLAKMLAKKGDAGVTLYVADVGQPEREEGGLLLRPLIRMDETLRLSPGKALRVFRRLLQGKHDLYVTRSASGINGLVTLAARRGGGRHLHMCAHDDECSGRMDSTLGGMARRLQRLALHRADVLTCQTRSQQEALLEHVGREALVCPNLLPPTEEVIPGESERKGVLWVGRDVDWKQPELFVELARCLPEYKFTMVCQPQAGRDITRITKEAPNNLELFPGLSFEETAKHFLRHKVYISTSCAEGFPNTFLQSANAGTPIVSLEVDPEGVLGRQKIGFACEGVFPELVEQMRRLLSDANAWTMCHEKAIEFAKQFQESNAAEVEGIIRKCLSETRPSVH